MDASDASSKDGVMLAIVEELAGTAESLRLMKYIHLISKIFS